MKYLTSYIRKLALSGLLGLAFVSSACAQTPPTGANTTSTPLVIPTAAATSASQPSKTQGSTSGNTTITYANVDVTILSVDQQSSFKDDSGTSSPMVVRINTKEQSQSSTTVFFFYNDSMRLVLADGKRIAPTNTAHSSGIDQGVVRNNWMDFSVDKKQDMNTLILRIGTTTENQMDVPLSKHPDLAKYQPRVVTPGNKLQYGGVNWTITRVTASLSANGKQATSGKRYIVVELKADNPTTKEFFPFPSDNFRLKTNTAEQAPADSTLPSSIAAGSQGTTGTVTFLMPQNDRAFTLRFQAQSSGHVNGASTNFQIQ